MKLIYSLFELLNSLFVLDDNERNPHFELCNADSCLEVTESASHTTSRQSSLRSASMDDFVKTCWACKMNTDKKDIEHSNSSSHNYNVHTCGKEKLVHHSSLDVEEMPVMKWNVHQDVK